VCASPAYANIGSDLDLADAVRNQNGQLKLHGSTQAVFVFGGLRVHMISVSAPSSTQNAPVYNVGNFGKK
jgi:hypothetical protein